MKRTLSFAFALTFGCLSFYGCSSSSSSSSTPTDGGTPPSDGDTSDSACVLPPPVCSDPTVLSDPTQPPPGCTPSLCSCKAPYDSSACGTFGVCHATVDQSGGTVANLRMGRIRLFAPDSLVQVAKIAVTPGVSSTCEHAGTEAFNWLMQIDTSANTLKTGGARYSATESYTFLDGQSVSPADISSICSGFTSASTTAIDLSSISAAITFAADGTFSTPVVPKLNVPIFTDTTPTAVPIVLPLSEVQMSSVALSKDHNCIGSFNSALDCDGDSGGWTTAGIIVGKITLDEAEQVPVKDAGCQSLCSLITGQGVGGHCPTDSSGHVTVTGNACVGGTGCNNAYTLSAAFSAYGVTITGASPTGGADSGT